MKVGECCKLIILFDLGYGFCGVGGVIFFDVIFIFDVELLRIVNWYIFNFVFL